MEHIVIWTCIAAIIITAVIIYAIRKKNATVETQNSLNDMLTDRKNNQLTIDNKKLDELEIQIEMLPAESIPHKNNLVEITDSKVLAHVNNLIPELLQARVADNNTMQAAKAGGEVLYRAIIPAGAKLANSKTAEGAVRGFYHGADGIQGHANLVAVEAQKGTAVVVNTVAAAMGVASMIVGQYYMTQIHTELGKINDNISKITDFQDNEFRSRLFSLVAHVKKIADFQIEILENDELRLTKIEQLDNLEEECTKLLGQTNLTLAGYAKRNDLDYEEYERELKNAQNWHMYQNALLDVLYKISDLRYTLHFGAVSREQCTALLPTYTKQVSDTQEMLAGWHRDSVKRLSIDTENEKRKRDGFDGFIHLLPGLFNNDLNFRAIEKDTAAMIASQTLSSDETTQQDNSDLYAEDVQLISKDGKIYYLPQSKME